jgi:hypothetical protein
MRLINAIRDFVGSYHVINEMCESGSKPKELIYISPIDFIDGLNNKKFVPESLNIFITRSEPVYGQKASRRGFLRKRRVYYTETKLPIRDSNFEFNWSGCLHSE